MITPRDFLLARHQSAAPKLDAIRHAVVEELNNQGTKEPSIPAFLIASLLGGFNIGWRELVFPCRRIWTGLAMVWVVLVIFNYSQRDGSQVVMAKSSSSTAMAMTFRDQQKLLNELFAGRLPKAEADQPRVFTPKPRTEKVKFYTV